jgi:UDP:flavonoid glycosyltransferase YjiC (YdhE family)
MALISPYRPPHTPDFWMLKGEPTTWAGVTWNRLVLAGARAMFRRRYGPVVNRLRAEHGLSRGKERSLLDISKHTGLTLCCYSPLFGQLPPDAAANTRVVGFPVYDADSGTATCENAELEAFLAAGPPPLVFTLGSFAVHAPGDFYREAAETARLLGRRAVLLTGPGSTMRSSENILVLPYAPHSTLFSRSLAIIHHGGVGTTGQALRAGKPQLIVPHMGDQWDNAHRVKQMGLSKVLLARRFTAQRAARRIAALIDPRRPYIRDAARIGAIIIQEDGAENAALAIEKLLDRAG